MRSISLKQAYWFILLCCVLVTAVACNPIATESTPPEIGIAPVETVSTESVLTESIPVEEDAMQPVYLLGDGQTVPGWYSAGTIQWSVNDGGGVELGSDGFETGIDPNVSHSGGQSGFIRGIETQPIQVGSLVQTISAMPYRSQRINFSTYLKTEAVEHVAGAGVIVFDADFQPVNLYNWRFGNLRGTNDWQRTDIVLDVPEDAVYLSIHTALQGNGIVWVDDWAIEIVDETTPITQAYAFNNPSFEEFNNNFPAGWLLAGSQPQDYEVDSDTQHVRDGQFSVTMRAEDAAETKFGTLQQTFPAQPYWGQRLRLTGFVRTELADNGVTMWMRVDGEPATALRYDNTAIHGGGPIRGSTDWNLLTIVMDVPEGGSDINLGFTLAGNGQIWVDDLLLETVGDEIDTTSSAHRDEWRLALNPFLKDPLFSASELGKASNGWFATGSRVEGYEIGMDTAVGHTDNQSGYVKYVGGESGLGTLAQAFLSKPYRGERVQVHAYTRAENTNQQASFWLRVNGEQWPLVLATVPLDDTAGWQLQEFTLDIPANSLTISLGVTNAGRGTVWIDDVTFDIVDESIPATDLFDAADFTNLDFEAVIE